MKQSGRMYGLMGAAGMLLLILDSRTALQGAGEGLELCIRTVIPALFPFFVLSTMMISGLTVDAGPGLRPLGKLTGIPEGAELILLTGMLGGYPVGARCIAQAHKNGQLPISDARRMMGFCNNAGPSFLFGIAAGLFPHMGYGWALWAIQILSALAVGYLLPEKSSRAATAAPQTRISPTEALHTAVRSMAGVCGWVVLFRVILSFLERWILWLANEELCIVLTGVLELTNGCCSLSSIQNMGLRFVLCSGFLTFGGLCVAMQTISEAKDIGPGLYFPGKCLQTLISILLAASVQMLFPPEFRMDISPVFLILTLIFILLFCFFPGKNKKRGSIPKKAIV